MNIAEILKNCPEGIKLYSPIFGELKFGGFISSTGRIKCYINSSRLSIFYPDGTYSENGEIMLFPSKEQRDWSKFQIPFKFGDIVAMYNEQCQHTNIGIFNTYTHDDYVNVICTNLAGSNKIKIMDEQDGWDKQGVRYAREEEKEFFFDLLREQNYVWTGGRLIEKKFDPRSLKPYDKVLVKNGDGCWYPSLVSYVNSSGCVCIIDCDNSADYTIPFEGNEHLIGKFDDPDPYYITWE